MAENTVKHLIVAADDFGRTSSINRAIAEAHDRGIVTAASIMAGGEAFQEAVRIALSRSRLSVGLHLTLCDGRAVLPYSRIPDIADINGYLEKNPSKAWLKYTRSALLPQIEMEIEAQFNRLEEAGIRPSHVDCHHHLHMHPFVFKALCRLASKRGVRWIRIPKESLSTILSSSYALRGAMPFLEWAVFGILSAYNLKIAHEYKLYAAHKVYGLAQTGNIDEKYLLDILARIDNLTEIFTHPDISTKNGRKELDALTSTNVHEALFERGIVLSGYKELLEEPMAFNSALERS